jgi:hypothetical protein
MNSDISWEIPEDDPCRLAWQASDAKLVTTMHAMSRGWPSVEGGIEVWRFVPMQGIWSKSALPVGAFVFVLICPFNLISRLYYSSVSTSDGSCASFGSHRRVNSVVVP